MTSERMEEMAESGLYEIIITYRGPSDSQSANFLKILIQNLRTSRKSDISSVFGNAGLNNEDNIFVWRALESR